MNKLTSTSSAIAKHIKKLGKSKSYREEHKQFICVGDKLFSEAITCGVHIEVVVTSKMLQHKFPESVSIYSAKDNIIDSISPMQNSQGLLFVCRMPEASNYNYTDGTHVLVDCVQDPGNIGTIIRSALAFGVSTVILTNGCADLYNPKTIRATMGAMFKQRIIYMTSDEINDLKMSGIRFFGASNEDNSIDICKVNLTNAVIILGSEGQGISNYLKEFCNEMIRIPISSEVESINVSTAAAIIMWEASKGMS
ncbi:MAG: RNA methyltransferase [Oscillospiraceae bacterium]|nr:RNA methyltransferase [Oscillospiraceae bacterium]